jgi:hypothetical protein
VMAGIPGVRDVGSVEDRLAMTVGAGLPLVTSHGGAEVCGGNGVSATATQRQSDVPSASCEPSFAGPPLSSKYVSVDRMRFLWNEGGVSSMTGEG